MSRYIDAELVPSLFDEKFKETRKLICQGETHLDNLAEGFLEADRVIQKIPTADVVEVVRCKDCKHRETFAPVKEIGKEAVVSHRCILSGAYKKADGFCDYGERRGK